MSVYASTTLLPEGAIVVRLGTVLAWGLDGPEIVSFDAPTENPPVVPQDGRGCDPGLTPSGGLNGGLVGIVGEPGANQGGGVN